MALTASREAFCQHYAIHRKGPDAYRAAFNVKPSTTEASAATEASKLLAIPDIRQRIDELVTAQTGDLPAVFTIRRALEMWLDLAQADPNELIGLKVGACRYCWGDQNLYQWKEAEYWEAVAAAEKEAAKDPDAGIAMPDVAGGFGFMRTRAPNDECPRCEGEGIERVVPRDSGKLSKGAKMLYGGVKQTRNGLEVVIADRTKALENASRIVGAFKDNIKLDGTIGMMAQVVQTEVTDPAEAAKLYQQMVAKIST